MPFVTFLHLRPHKCRCATSSDSGSPPEKAGHCSYTASPHEQMTDQHFYFHVTRRRMPCKGCRGGLSLSVLRWNPTHRCVKAHQNQVTALCAGVQIATKRLERSIASAKTERGHGNQKKNIGERSACWLEGLSLLVAIAASPTLLSLTAIVFHRGQREIIFGIRGYQRQLPQCKSKCTLLHLLYSRERMSQEKRRNVGIGRPRFLHCMCFLTFHRLECNSASLFCPRHDQQTIFDRGIFDFRSRTCMCTSHSFQLAPVGLVSATRCQFSASVL